MSITELRFENQNIWLKLTVFILSVWGAITSIPAHLILQIVLYLSYFVLDLTIYPKLLTAIRRMLIFVSAYWVLGTLVQTDFIEMCVFSLRLLLLLLSTVYLFSCLKLSVLLGDTLLLSRFRFYQKTLYFMIATMLFVKEYALLYRQSASSATHTISGILERLSGILSQCFNRAEEIEKKTSLILHGKIIKHDRLSPANLTAVFFLCISMLLYAL